MNEMSVVNRGILPNLHGLVGFVEPRFIGSTWMMIKQIKPQRFFVE